jgi:hypothetical protein
MDEQSTRTLLRYLAEADQPRTQVDLGRAISGGKRRRRRRAGLRMASVALLVSGVVGAAIIPASRHGHDAAPVTARPDHRATEFDPAVLNLSVGWQPKGVTGTAILTATDHQALELESAKDARNLAEIWLVTKAASLSVYPPDQTPVAGPPLHGVSTRWYADTKAGGVLAWKVAPDVEASVKVTDAQATAVRIATSLRTDARIPMKLPFTVAVPRGLKLEGVSANRSGEDWSGGAVFIPAASTSRAPASLQVSLAKTTKGLPHAANATINGHPAWVLEGKPELPTNVQVSFGPTLLGGVFAALDPNAKTAKDRAFLNRTQCLLVATSLRQVSDPSDYASWTSTFIR